MVIEEVIAFSRRLMPEPFAALPVPLNYSDTALGQARAPANEYFFGGGGMRGEARSMQAELRQMLSMQMLGSPQLLLFRRGVGRSSFCVLALLALGKVFC